MSSLWDEGASGHQRQQLTARIMRRDHGLCQCRHCKASGEIKQAHHVDHIVPREAGGTDDESNLQAINVDCHKRKSDEDAGRAHVKREGVGVDGIPKGWQ